MQGPLYAPLRGPYPGDMRKPRPHHFRRILVAVFVATVCVPAGSAAFDVLREPEGRAVRWPDRPVAVFLQAKVHHDLSVDDLHQALQRAIGRWNKVPGHRLELVDGGLVDQPPGFDIYVSFGTPVAAASERTGRLFMDYDKWGGLQRVEVLLDAHTWRFALGSLPVMQPIADLEGALVHHLGHAIGLGHSRALSSSLYFAAADATSRTLHPDDERGIRWLYADKPPTDGGLCDTCSGDDQCASGICATWPSKDSYCVDACDNHEDCPIGYSCGGWGGAGKVCLPNERHCAPELAASKAGGACASDLPCPEPLGCLPAEVVGMCTALCVTDCGVFGQCREVFLGNQYRFICLVPGGTSAGSRCMVTSDCANNRPVCAPNIAGGGTCSSRCLVDSHCKGAGVQCDGGGFCTTKGQLPVGWPCASGFDCQTGKCVVHPGGPYDRACAAPCEVAADCPAGTGCTPLPTGSWCLPYGPPVYGAPCSTPGACGPGALCDVGLVPGLGACQAACDPFGDGAECPAGQRCVWVGAPSALNGACRDSGGGQSPGSGCSAGAPCRVDLVCADAGSGATCLADCDPDANDGGHGACGAGEQCVLLDSTGTVKPRRGACSTAAGPLKHLAPTPDKDGDGNFAATALNLPGVEPWRAPGPPKSADEPVVDEGCVASPRRGGNLPTAIMLALALGLLASIRYRVRWRL